jgi:hypothetical protein
MHLEHKIGQLACKIRYIQILQSSERDGMRAETGVGGSTG